MGALEAFSLVARITLDSDDYEKELNEAGNDTNNFGKKMGNALKTAGKVGAAAMGVASAAVVGLVKGAIDSYADYEQLVGGVETLYKSSADKVLEYSRQAYKTAGMSANDYMETATSFAAALVNSLGGDTDKAAEMANMAITDMSDNVNKMGSDVEAVQNAYNGFAKGNFTMLDNLKLGYGGTKEEMQRLLDKAGEISGYKYDISSYADIVQAIHVVQDEMGVTGTTMREAEATISGSLAMTKASWENLIIAIGDGNNDISDEVQDLINSAGSFVNNLVPVIQTALTGIADFVTQVVPVVMEKMPEFIAQVLPGLLDAAWTLVTSVIENLPAMLDSIATAVAGVVDTISKYLHEKNPVLGEAFDSVVGVIQTVFENLTTFINEILIPVVGDVATAFATFWTETLAPLATFLSNTFIEAWRAIKNFYVTYMKPKVETLMASFKEFWEKVLVPLGTFLEQGFLSAWTAIKNFFSETVQPIVGELAGFFKYMWDEVLVPIATFLKETFQPAFKVVSDFLSGTFGTVISKTTTAIDNVKTVAKPVSDFFEGAFSSALDFAGKAFDGLMGWAEPVASFLGDTLFEAMKDICDIAGDVIDAIADVIDWARGAKTKLQSFINKAWEAQQQAISVASNSASDWYDGGGFRQYAEGGKLHSGDFGIVGEAGPEFLSVKNGVATVTPFNKGASPLGAGGSTFTFNIYTQAGQDEETIARAVQRQFVNWEMQRKAAYV